MQFYVADYLGDTRHLTTEQHGAYLLLLMAMWRANGVLPNEPAKLARIAGLTASRWAKICDDVMAFFDIYEDGITQGRLAAELAIANEKSEKRSQAGKAGARAKSLKDNKAASANASRLLKHSPEPEPELDIEAYASCPAKPNVVPKDDLFSEAWKAYPAKGRERSKSQAKTRPIWKEAARLAGGEDALLGAVRRYVRDDQTHKGECGPPAFDKWLRDGRWEHWLEMETRRVATWTGPAEIRERVVAEKGDGFAASYLDPAVWTDRGEILAATGYAAEKLRALGYLRLCDFPGQPIQDSVDITVNRGRPTP